MAAAGAEDCKVDQLQPGGYRYWLLNLGAREAESDGSWANAGENRVEGEGEVLSRPGGLSTTLLQACVPGPGAEGKGRC